MTATVTMAASYTTRRDTIFPEPSHGEEARVEAGRDERSLQGRAA